jgi:hypothetical protein
MQTGSTEPKYNSSKRRSKAGANWEELEEDITSREKMTL